jgi:hypothetical protein
LKRYSPCTVFSPDFREGSGSEFVTLGAPILKNRSADDVERFLSLLTFENKGILEELPDLDLGL